MAEAEQLQERAAAGDAGAWGALLTAHEERLRRVVAFRMDRRLQGRLDASDIMQEAFMEATARRGDYFARPTLPLFLWLRGIVANKIRELHRHHLGTLMRDAGREAAPRLPAPDVTSLTLIAQLMSSGTGPGTAVARAEVNERVQSALSGMDEIDREALALRHFEQLTNAEAAHVLGIEERAAAKRYVRALKRLKDLLADMPGGLTGLRT
jgi:RNA polymerase sigma-70 factor (ECF subfamily)